LFREKQRKLPRREISRREACLFLRSVNSKIAVRLVSFASIFCYNFEAAIFRRAKIRITLKICRAPPIKNFMSDVLGLLFFVLLLIGIFVGLKILAKPHTRTEAEFERNIAESTSLLGAGVNALQEGDRPGGSAGERSSDAIERRALREEETRRKGERRRRKIDGTARKPHHNRRRRI
jgi:hypothetical protein